MEGLAFCASCSWVCAACPSLHASCRKCAYITSNEGQLGKRAMPHCRQKAAAEQAVREQQLLEGSSTIDMLWVPRTACHACHPLHPDVVSKPCNWAHLEQKLAKLHSFWNQLTLLIPCADRPAGRHSQIETAGPARPRSTQPGVLLLGMLSPKHICG